MGLAFSAAPVREARQIYPRTSRGDRRRTDPRPFQRPGREHQHQTAAGTRVAFGFRSPEALVALAMLDLGGMCPPLPGRAAA